MGQLKHFRPTDLEFLFAQMRRVLVPGGLGSHVVDHRDHYWHYDKSIHCFHHLTFSDSRMGGRQQRTEGLQKPAARARLHPPVGTPRASRCWPRSTTCTGPGRRGGVEPEGLWGPYARLTTDDLRAAVSHFVVRSR